MDMGGGISNTILSTFAHFGKFSVMESYCYHAVGNKVDCVRNLRARCETFRHSYFHTLGL